MAPDLSDLTVRELLLLETSVVTELRRRELVRTNNKPLGDIAEQIVLRARGGVIEPNSTKSHDVTTANGHRIQVKAMGKRASGRAAKFSPFRSFEFDSAVFLVFNAETFDLEIARETGPAEIEAVARYSPHTNGSQPTLRQVANLGTDVLHEMATAFQAIENA